MPETRRPFMSPATENPISVPLVRLRPLFDEAYEAGIDGAGLLRSLDLDPALAVPGASGTMSLADYYRVQNRLAILFGDETLHVSARQLLPGSTDFVLQHVSDCKTIFDVMRIIAQSYNLLHGGKFNSVQKKQNTVDYFIDDRDFPYVKGASTEFICFSIECTLVFLHGMLITIDPEIKNAVTGVQIRRLTPGGECGHLGYWDVPIRFGADVYRISFDRNVALQPVSLPSQSALTANAVYQTIIDVAAGRQAQSRKIMSATSRVRDAFERGVIEQSEIAQQMGVSVATLRRRLTDEGVSFRDLRRDVLNETARRLLRENHNISDVAETIGFSDARSFTRAFKEWNGLTPKAFSKSNTS